MSFTHPDPQWDEFDDDGWMDRLPKEEPPLCKRCNAVPPTFGEADGLCSACFFEQELELAARAAGAIST